MAKEKPGLTLEIARHGEFPWNVKVKIMGVIGRTSVHGHTRSLNMGLYEETTPSEWLRVANTQLWLGREDGKSVTSGQRRAVVSAVAKLLSETPTEQR